MSISRNLLFVILMQFFNEYILSQYEQNRSKNSEYSIYIQEGRQNCVFLNECLKVNLSNNEIGLILDSRQTIQVEDLISYNKKILLYIFHYIPFLAMRSPKLTQFNYLIIYLSNIPFEERSFHALSIYKYYTQNFLSDSISTIMRYGDISRTLTFYVTATFQIFLIRNIYFQQSK